MGNDISLSQAQQELVDWVKNGDSCSLASAIVLGSNSILKFFSTNDKKMLFDVSNRIFF